MSQLGELLRNMRESKGISLSQAAAETRILQRYLVALEEGDYLNPVSYTHLDVYKRQSGRRATKRPRATPSTTKR